jgi:hypothetical protein
VFILYYQYIAKKIQREELLMIAKRYLSISGIQVLIVLATYALVGCGGDKSTNDTPQSTTGTIQVITSTTGPDPDPDGYTVTIEQATLNIGVNDTIISGSVPADSTYLVTLGDLAANCMLSGSNPRETDTVRANSTTTIQFDITSTAITGAIEVTTVTAGSDLDNDYRLVVDGTDTIVVSTASTDPDTGSVTITGLTAGDHTVQLIDVAGNCSILGSNPQTVAVQVGDTTQALFLINCGASVAPNAIVFSSSKGTAGNNEIWVMDTLGMNITQLTSFGLGQDAYGPAFSQDGSRIVFWVWNTSSSDRDIWVMNANGSGQQNITNTPDTVEFNPDWSPDGSKIVFLFLPPQRPADYIAVMDANGVGRDTIFTSPPGMSNVGDPRWSPDGTKIAFSADENEKRILRTHVYVIDTSGSNLTQLTPSGQDYWYHDWSPDGNKFALVGGSGGISVMDANGSNLVGLPTDISASDPVWSPNGFKIAYLAGCGDIWVISADGTPDSTNLTQNCALASQIDWNPIE